MADLAQNDWCAALKTAKRNIDADSALMLNVVIPSPGITDLSAPRLMRRTYRPRTRLAGLVWTEFTSTLCVARCVCGEGALDDLRISGLHRGLYPT
jgi:hypothetical protein